MGKKKPIVEKKDVAYAMGPEPASDRRSDLNSYLHERDIIGSGSNTARYEGFSTNSRIIDNSQFDVIYNTRSNGFGTKLSKSKNGTYLLQEVKGDPQVPAGQYNVLKLVVSKDGFENGYYLLPGNYKSKKNPQDGGRYPDGVFLFPKDECEITVGKTVSKDNVLMVKRKVRHPVDKELFSQFGDQFKGNNEGHVCTEYDVFYEEVKKLKNPVIVIPSKG